MAIEPTRVEGRDVGPVLLYALSTCIWCRRTKQLLQDLGVAYDYIDVDLLSDEERETIRTEVRRWNRRGSFPTLVVRGETGIGGFDEERIREVLGS